MCTCLLSHFLNIRGRPKNLCTEARTHTHAQSYCITHQFVRRVCIIRKFDLILFAMLKLAFLTHCAVYRCNSSSSSRLMPRDYCNSATTRCGFDHFQFCLPCRKRKSKQTRNKQQTGTYLFDQERHNVDRLS